MEMKILGVLMIALGLAILIYGMRIARVYAILSAFVTAVSIGLGLAAVMAMAMGMDRQMIIPVLIALAIVVLLLVLVGKFYQKYLAFYAVLGLIKIAASVALIPAILLNIRGGWVVVLALVILVAGIIGLIRLVQRWAHLLSMLGLMADGAVIAAVGAVMLGFSNSAGFGIACSVLGIPLLMWTGLYHECWRSKLPFPGVQSW